MVDRKFLRLLLNKLSRENLQEFASGRVDVHPRARKRDIVDYFTTSYVASEDDIDELQSLVSGNPLDRGFNVFLYEMPDTLPRHELLQQVTMAAEASRESESDEKLTIVQAEDDTDSPIVVDFRYNEDSIIVTADGTLARGVQMHQIRFRLRSDIRLVEVCVGNAVHAARASSMLGQLLGTSFRPLIPKGPSANLAIGELNSLTVFFMDLLFNRLVRTGRIENVERLTLDTNGVEANLRQVKLIGDHVFESARACQMLIKGQQIIGVRFLYRFQVGIRSILTHVTLSLSEQTGLKVIIAQSGCPMELIEQLFATIRDEYNDLVSTGTVDVDLLSGLYDDMVTTAQAG